MSDLGEWLDAVEERVALTTRGPWWLADGEDDFRVEDDAGETIATLPVIGKAEQFLRPDLDAEFIAHAREDVPRLVGMLRRALNRDALAEVLGEAYSSSPYRDAHVRGADAVVAFIEGTETDRV